MEFLQNLFLLLGRVLIGGMFLWGAYEKLRHWQAAMDRMKAKHIPQPGIVMPVAMALKIIGGLLVVFGWHAHIGALLLLIVAIPFLFWSHPFWKMHGNERMVDGKLFMKEVAVIGGLFLLLAMGAGHFGVGGGG